MKIAKFIPWIAGGLALAFASAALLPPAKVRGFDLDGFAGLPVLEGGRSKPLDSLARNALLVIRSQQSFQFQGRSLGADEWLLDLLFRPEVSDTQAAFVINDPDVLGLLGLKQSSDRYFAFKTLEPSLAELERQATAAQAVEAQARTRFERAIVNLFERLVLFRKTAETKADGATIDQWTRLGRAWAAQDAVIFNSVVGELQTQAKAARPELVQKAERELLFNRAQPFYAGMIIYVLALLALFASWLGKPAWLALAQRTALGLLCAGALVHTAGLTARIVLQGRPPVTNLYSSAIFIGWAAVLIGILLERIYRRGFGTAVAASSGFASLIIAHHLASDGDTMEMMRAVLDSNFWLATHVVTVTIGYSGAFLAGALGLAYAAWRHLAPRPDPATGKTLASMAYGVICFALFFSFVGTVLGGIWADQSWGRFWGWDPKENGALLIVLWNATILHARWGGFVRVKGLMAMAIFGNVITSLSWFGVNMLGVGLHSYGFMDSAFFALSVFIGSQLLALVLCLAPRRFERRVKLPRPAAPAAELPQPAAAV